MTADIDTVHTQKSGGTVFPVPCCSAAYDEKDMNKPNILLDPLR